MATFLPKSADRRPMLRESTTMRESSTAAAVLWTISQTRDPEVLPSFRIHNEDLLAVSRSYFKTMPRHLRISVTHGGHLAHLYLFKDASAFLSRETAPCTHDVHPLPLKLNLSPDFLHLQNHQLWFSPALKIWAEGCDGVAIGIHARHDDVKSQAIEFLDFRLGDKTVAQHEKFQSLVDLIIHDIRRGADVAAAMTDPCVPTKPPGAKLEDGSTNRWPEALPFSVLSNEEITEIERRAYLACLKVYHDNEFEGTLSSYSHQCISLGRRANKVVALNGGSLTYFLKKHDITEQDFLGYDPTRLDGFRFQMNERNGETFLPIHPRKIMELSPRIQISDTASAHDLIEMEAELVAARRRKQERLARVQKDALVAG